MVLNDGDISLGDPLIEGAAVDAKVIEQFRDKKIEIVKFKRRKHYKRRAGHRQSLTRIEIMDVRSS